MISLKKDKEKKRQEVVNCGNFHPCRIFKHEKLAIKVIMGCRTTESCKFKRKLGFQLHDVINTKEQTVLESIKDAFEGENMQTQYKTTELIFIFMITSLQ